mmetsp:Transcript_3048/g.10021  ORF Transcript_3048/g.10021 Transcript_3048/m.10021 type:complete len:226 (-) Transcript_3048:114-791(-)
MPSPGARPGGNARPVSSSSMAMYRPTSASSARVSSSADRPRMPQATQSRTLSRRTARKSPPGGRVHATVRSRAERVGSVMQRCHRRWRSAGVSSGPRISGGVEGPAVRGLAATRTAAVKAAKADSEAAQASRGRLSVGRAPAARPTTVRSAAGVRDWSTTDRTKRAITRGDALTGPGSSRMACCMGWASASACLGPLSTLGPSMRGAAGSRAAVGARNGAHGLRR